MCQAKNLTNLKNFFNTLKLKPFHFIDPETLLLYFELSALRADFPEYPDLKSKNGNSYTNNGHVRPPGTTKNERTRTADRELFHIKFI